MIVLNKKGISDVPLLVVLGFVFAIVLIFSKVAFDNVATSFEGSDIDQSINATGQFNANYVEMFDSLFVMMLVFITIAVIFVSSRLNVHPAFYIFAILLLAILVVVSGLLSESWGEFQTDSSVGATVAEFTMMNFILDNFGLFIALLGGLGLIVLYAKGLS